jgi:hypothetical protein
MQRVEPISMFALAVVLSRRMFWGQMCKAAGTCARADCLGKVEPVTRIAAKVTDAHAPLQEADGGPLVVDFLHLPTMTTLLNTKDTI